MLNKVEARTDGGVMLSLPLDDISEGYSVQGIDGLDPVPANIVSTSFARLDGEQYQSARRQRRNLIFRLGLEADYTNKTVSELRNDLYRFFMPRQRASFRFYADGVPNVDISGRIETFDCPLFVKEPIATISVLCFDPDFYEPVEVTLTGSTTAGTTMSNIDYSGTVDSGGLFTINVNRSITGFTIFHQPEGEQIRSLVVTGAFIAGDVVRISTIPGDKYATRTRGGVVSSVLYAVSPYSDWTKLQPGNNGIRITVAGAAIPYTFSFTTKHGGL